MRADPEINVYQSLVHLRPTFQDPSLVAYLIIKRLTRIAEIIDTAPGLERIENGLVGGKVKIMYSCRLGPEEVNRFFSEQLVRLFSVESFENYLME